MGKKHPQVSIFGGFARKRISPENVLKSNLELNPIYPFEMVELHVYMFRTCTGVLKGVWLFFLRFMATAFVYGIWLSGTFDVYMLLPSLLILYFIYLGICEHQWKTLIIYSKLKQYEYYIGNMLVYTGHLHNVYIRLKGMKSGGDDVYMLTIDGFMVDEKALTGLTDRHDYMAKLGRLLAYRLDINFFDDQDRSKYHVVRHRCPYQIDLRHSM